MDRRNFLNSTAVVGAAGLAGCTNLLEDVGDGHSDSSDDDDGYEDNGGEEEPEISYKLEIRKLGDADYTNLEFEEGQQFLLEQLREEQDHGQLTYTVNKIKKYETQRNEKTPVDPNQISNIEVELNKYDQTFSLEELEQLENTHIDTGDNTLQIGYQELLQGENHIHITATLENQETTLTADTTIQKKDPKKEHQQLRQEYRDKILEGGINTVDWENWVDQNIDDMKVEENPDPDSPHSEFPYVQRQLATIANEWVGKVTENTKPSLRAEQLGMTLEYAFQEHLDTELQAGQISNNHLRGGTHHTVIARNPETENIWHVDTGGGHTFEPERYSGDGGRYRMSLDWGHHHTEERHYAETLATAFTRTQGLSDIYENLRHTDEALEHIVTLKRENGDYSTIEEQTRNAALLAHKYPDQQFQIDLAENGETDLVITTQ